jgi:hypothetical protein
MVRLRPQGTTERSRRIDKIMNRKVQATNSKYLMCGLIAGLIICSSAGTNIANAVSGIVTQTVTITVPPIRALYVDEGETIVAIFSNTQTIADEKLQVFSVRSPQDKDGLEITVSDEIRCQYEKLLPRVNWSRIGWVYQSQDSETELLKTTLPAEEPSETVHSNLENGSALLTIEGVHSRIAREVSICSVLGTPYGEAISGEQQQLNSPPLSPRKGNYIIKATIYDVEEGLPGVSVEYLL